MLAAFTKTPFAEPALAVTWAAAINGATVSSFVLTAFGPLPATDDATATIVETGTDSIVGAVTAQRVKGGTAGQTYTLVYVATLSNGEVLEERRNLVIAADVIVLAAFSKKVVSEVILYTNWAASVPQGLTISSFDAIATGPLPATDDVSSTITDQTTKDISGLVTSIMVRNGAHGDTYRLAFRVTLSDGQKLEAHRNLTVANPA